MAPASWDETQDQTFVLVHWLCCGTYDCCHYHEELCLKDKVRGALAQGTATASRLSQIVLHGAYHSGLRPLMMKVPDPAYEAQADLADH